MTVVPHCGHRASTVSGMPRIVRLSQGEVDLVQRLAYPGALDRGWGILEPVQFVITTPRIHLPVEPIVLGRPSNHDSVARQLVASSLVRRRRERRTA